MPLIISPSQVYKQTGKHRAPNPRTVLGTCTELRYLKTVHTLLGQANYFLTKTYLSTKQFYCSGSQLPRALQSFLLYIS